MSSEPAGRTRPERQRLRLIDAVIFIAAAAVALATVRGLENLGQLRTWLGSGFGLILAPTAVLLGTALAVRGFRGRPGSRVLSLWERAWRLAAACLLFIYALRQSVALREKFEYITYSPSVEFPRRLLPAFGVLGLLGLALGCGPVRGKEADGGRNSGRGRFLVGIVGAWLMVVMAALWISVAFDSIDYLVLLAIDGVANARSLGSTMERAPLDQRSHGALLALVPTAFAWSLLVGWLVSRNRAGVDTPRPKIAVELGPGLLLAITTFGFGFYFWRFAAPRFSPEYSWAAEWVLGVRGLMPALVCGLLVLSAGQAARSAAIGCEAEAGRSPVSRAGLRRVAKFAVRGVVVLVAIWVLFETVPQIVNLALPEAGFVPRWVRQRPPPFAWLQQAPMLWQVRAGIASGDRPRPWWTGFEVLWDSMFIVPQVVYIGVAGVWIVSAWKRRSGCAAAFDVVGRDRLTAARFGVLWLLWFVALAVSLPVIGVGSVLIRVEQAVHLWI